MTGKVVFHSGGGVEDCHQGTEVQSNVEFQKGGGVEDCHQGTEVQSNVEFDHVVVVGGHVDGISVVVVGGISVVVVSGHVDVISVVVVG